MKANYPMMIVGIVFAIVGSVADCAAQSQIPRAEERIRRDKLNARPHLTLRQVKAHKIDLEGEVFRYRLFVNTQHDIEQLEANRFQLWLSHSLLEPGGVALAHIPRAGRSTLGDKIRQGDVVLARIKEDEPSFTIEIAGVSAVGVWE